MQRALTSDEKNIIQAAFVSPQFKNIPEENQASELGLLILKIEILYSIKEENLNSDDDIILIHNFFKKHYRSLTLAELLEAAELNLKDELKVEYSSGHWSQINPYGYIDLKFLTKLISTYQVRKIDAFREFRMFSVNPMENKSLPQDQHTNEDWYKSLVKYIKEENQMPLIYPFEFVFIHMWNAGMIKESKQELQEFYNQIEAKVVLEISSERKSALLNLPIDAKGMADRFSMQIAKNKYHSIADPKNTQAICRKEFVIKKLQYLIKDDKVS